MINDTFCPVHYELYFDEDLTNETSMNSNPYDPATNYPPFVTSIDIGGEWTYFTVYSNN